MQNGKHSYRISNHSIKYLLNLAFINLSPAVEAR